MQRMMVLLCAMILSAEVVWGAPILTDGFGNQVFVLGTDVFEILYNGGTGNDVTLVEAVMGGTLRKILDGKK
jgi:hypothetical protein